MKKILATILLFGALVSAANAFVPPIRMNVTPYQVTATIYNNWARPIICNGAVYGRTRYGNTFSFPMNGGIVWPGANLSLYVRAPYNDPFINGWSSINCWWY